MLRRELTVVALLAGALLGVVVFAVWEVARLAQDGRYAPDALWVVVGVALEGAIARARDLTRRP